MPEPISTLVIGIGMVAGSSLVNPRGYQNSVSSDGQSIENTAREIASRSQESVALSHSERTHLTTELRRVISEYVEDAATDADLTLPPKLAFTRAREFFKALPMDLPDPELAIDPDDGAISLEWYGGYRKVASVSINGSQRLSFAMIDGANIMNGAYGFSEDKIPETVLSAIREILS